MLHALLEDAGKLSTDNSGLGLQGLGLGLVGWLIQQSRKQTRSINRLRRDLKHGRKVIAAKLGISEDDLKHDEDEDDDI